METTRLSSKGQIIIPKSIRDALDLEPGMTFEVEVTESGLVLRPERRFARTGLDQVAGCLEWRGAPVSLEEMDAAVADEARRKSPL